MKFTGNCPYKLSRNLNVIFKLLKNGKILIFILFGANDSNFRSCSSNKGDRGSTVVKVLCLKSEGHWFDPSMCQWIFH